MRERLLSWFFFKLILRWPGLCAGSSFFAGLRRVLCFFFSAFFIARPGEAFLPGTKAFSFEIKPFFALAFVVFFFVTATLAPL